MLMGQKKYQLVITDGYDRIIESFIDDDMDVVVKQTANYNVEKLNKVVFYTLLIDGKRADQDNWKKFNIKYFKYFKVLRKIRSLNKDFEC